MTELVQLAEELVSLTGRIDAIKDLMRKILANGSDLHPRILIPPALRAPREPA